MDQQPVNIGEALRQCAAQNPQACALIEGSQRLTWQAVDQWVDAYCRVFAQNGLKPGQSVALWSVNSIPYALAWLALVRYGAYAFPLNTSLTIHELETLAQAGRWAWLLHGEGYKGCLYARALTALRADGVSLNTLELAHLHQLAAAQWGQPFEPDPALAQDGETLATVLYTSGSSGQPKGVMLSHQSLLNNARALVAGTGWQSSDCLCVVVPFFHCFGVTACLLAAVCSGMGLALIPRFRTAACLEAIQTAPCTVLSGVPSMFFSLLRQPPEKRTCLRQIRSGLVAGSPLTAADYDRILTLFEPDMDLLPSYGQTETSPACTLVSAQADLRTRRETVGPALPGVELRIVDETGQPVLTPAVGEIQTRGSHLMMGYWQEPERTQAAFTPDGWFKTGDRGCLDEQGNLHVMGRIKNLIIRGGENIAPLEIEAALRSLEAVQDCVVLGRPHPILQEEIVAALEIQPGKPWKEAWVRARLAEKLADSKIPVAFWVVAQLPRTGSGKLDIETIRQHFFAQPQHPSGASPPAPRDEQQPNPEWR